MNHHSFMTDNEEGSYTEAQVMDEHRENKRQNVLTDDQEYDHSTNMTEVEKMYKELENLEELIMKNKVRCHMLRVDLATQFNPQMVDTIRKTDIDCKRCTTKLRTELQIARE